MSKLYVVGTPIGNLGDITERAAETMRRVDLIVCEDTRVTKKLLNHLGINKPMESFHAQSGISKLKKILDRIEKGESVAYVTDSGTPGISDPGAFLVAEARKREIVISPIPGPSAITAALSVSGIPDKEFLFLGFLPHKKGREKTFKEIADSKRTVVFYESPHRIMKALESLNKHLVKDRRIVLGRELTKIHEEIVSGTAQEIFDYFNKNQDRIRGEFVCMVSGF